MQMAFVELWLEPNCQRRNRMDFNSISTTNTSPQPDSPSPPAGPAGFERQLREVEDSALPPAAGSPVQQGKAYSPYPDARHPYSQYLESGYPYSSLLDWHDDLYAPAARSPGRLVAARESSPQPGSQQPIAQAIAELPEFDPDLIWQNVEAGPSQAGPSQAGPSQAGPSQAGPSSSAGAALPELTNFIPENERLIADRWVFLPHTASDAQINILRRAGRLPSNTSRTTTFTMLGMPHTAEFRQEGFVRIKPSMDAGVWPGQSRGDAPTG
ncbi:Nodulation outer protein L [Bradyrhizobium ivorense]|nr:Nodulation outer protein L [Bradyrhizobium ivorense]